MTTYMTWETSGGKKGRCDAKCHNAKKPKCRCMCGGIMHGQATGKTAQQWQDYKDKNDLKILKKVYADMDAGKISRCLVRPELRKLPLQEVKEK